MPNTLSDIAGGDLGTKKEKRKGYMTDPTRVGIQNRSSFERSSNQNL